MELKQVSFGVFSQKIIKFMSIFVVMSIAEIQQLKKSMHLFLIIALFLSQAYSQIQLNLKNTQATSYANNKILIKFNVTGVQQPYFITFNGIPNEWKTRNNNLIIQNSDKLSNRNWTFDIAIKDIGRNTLTQTLKLILKAPNIQLLPITVPVVSVQQPNINQKAKQNRNTVLSDLINKYPGKQSANVGFNINYQQNSVLTSQLIKNAQAVYNPDRDSNPLPQSFKDALLLQSKIKMLSQNSYSYLRVMTSQSQKYRLLLSNLTVQEDKFQQFKNRVALCGDQVYNIQDTLAKINNALKDKNNKNRQLNIEKSQGYRKIDQLINNSSSKNQQKIRIQAQTKPEGLELTQIQSNIAKCQNNISSRNSKILNLNNNMSENNLKIQIAKDNTIEANNRLKTVDQSLAIVQQKISDLKKQLSEAQTQQKSLLNDKKLYQSTPINNKMIIQQSNKKNIEIGAQIKSLQDENNKQTSECSRLKDQATNKKQELIVKKKAFQKLVQEIQAVNKNIKQIQEMQKNNEISTKQLDSQISILNNQLSLQNERLGQQKYLCYVNEENKNKQAIRIEKFKFMINQTINSYNNYAKSLKMQGDQLLQASKSLDKIKINESLSGYSSLRPLIFSIYPNANSIAKGGGPLGNNPAGSALGQAFPVTNVLLNNITIPDLSQFFSSIFSMGLMPTDPMFQLLSMQKKAAQSNVPSPIYIVNKQSRDKLTGLNSEQFKNLTNPNCSNQPGQLRTGILEQITPGSLIIRDQKNNKFILSISACTKLISTTQNYTLKLGVKIVSQGKFVANFRSDNMIEAYTILFVVSPQTK